MDRLTVNKIAKAINNISVDFGDLKDCVVSVMQGNTGSGEVSHAQMCRENIIEFLEEIDKFLISHGGGQ